MVTPTRNRPCAWALAVGATLVQITGCAESTQQRATDTPRQALGEPNTPRVAPPANVDESMPLFNGKDLNGWRVADENTYEDPGKVHVQNGTIVLEQGKVSTGIVFTKDFPRVDYEVSLQARRTGGSDFFCGMTFPVGEDYCTLICGGWGGGTTGLSNVDGFAADENETSGFTEFQEGQWYEIRLRVTANKIQAWIDAEQIIDLDATGKKFDIWWEQEPLRPFGIGNWYTSSELRDLTLTRLGPDQRNPTSE